MRPGPADDATAVTAAQLRDAIGRLVQARQRRAGDPEIWIVMDSGYDVAYLSHALADLPVVLVGRRRSDRVMLRDPGPARSGPKGGRPRRHGGVLTFAKPDSWHEPEVTSVTDTTRYGKAEAKIRHADTADLWTWLIIAAHTQLRLARPLAEDLRRPWERQAEPRRLTLARVRRGFRNIRATTARPATAPKPSRPGPGRPAGSKNKHRAKHADVGKTVKRAESIKEHQARLR